ncbi:NlpC/P60 family peptidoglycan endopeptidase RipA [Mycobacterium sp. MYCO198283]|uniref:NlpC/P60 family peptidoglycan endopeptidase RipA n=1 Tax=Mycobacterium sp. MYCO198283 TaxID=2883505 RepID=UPI001E5B4565|nr:NlpC/P60 family peptidoglycan endopeptidase RipA [Mycobacterium sp. MYCO198283]MCG5433554.1 NlpC/P60 family peptidoglycan endopeptidase RipA [Mycobacterium sp. MYCO198283]
MGLSSFSRRARGCAAAVSLTLVLGTPGLAAAEPAPAAPPGDVASLIAAVADADQRLEDLGAQVQQKQESVNKAIAEVQTARDRADAARAEVAASRRAVADADTAIADAQHRLDAFAGAMYRGGPTMPLLAGGTPDEVLASASAGEAAASAGRQVLADLKAARTEQADRESRARAAQQQADEATAAAQHRMDDAVAALRDAQQTFGAQRTELDKLSAERADAQARLDAARAKPATVTAAAAAATTAPAAPKAPARGADWDAAPASAGRAQNWDTAWDPTLPQVPSAFVSGDPIAIVNAVLGISATSAQVTSDLGRNFLRSVGLLKPADTGITNGGRIPRVYGRQAAEYVIRRGMSQMGVPYSWGGGNAAGPSRGIDSGAGTVGFDCSGLVLYAFAGVGIKLPHYSGSQYEMGRKIPSSQMRRGDVIFYGPGGSQHVTIYLGNGQMLEAPYTGSTVKVSPVRTSGMTPYVVRYIEY